MTVANTLLIATSSRIFINFTTFCKSLILQSGNHLFHISFFTVAFVCSYCSFFTFSYFICICVPYTYPISAYFLSASTIDRTHNASAKFTLKCIWCIIFPWHDVNWFQRFCVICSNHIYCNRGLLSLHTRIVYKGTLTAAI